MAAVKASPRRDHPASRSFCLVLVAVQSLCYLLGGLFTGWQTWGTRAIEATGESIVLPMGGRMCIGYELHAHNDTSTRHGAFVVVDICWWV
jgi:hypothetical protein